MQILVVEDEKRLASALKEILTDQKFKVDVVNDGLDGYEYARSAIYDCIVLDVMLPGLNGFQVLEKLRNEGVDTPVLILTAKSLTSDKVHGLNIGADDYLTKPFEPLELVARIRALTRRKGEVILNKIEFGDLCYLIDKREVTNTINNKSIHLNFKEAELLGLFMKMPGAILSKEDIIVKVWGYDSEATDNNVEAYISFIRKKLAFLESKCEINALKKVGYTMVKKDD